MKIQSLAGQWNFRQHSVEGEQAAWLPAVVPGGVHTDLMAAGKIPDPFVADNEKAVMWVAESDWDYRLAFAPQAGLLDEEQVWLVLDGLDTLAELFLNGALLGKSENMFRRYAWDVKGRLRAGENELLVSFRSPVRFIQAEQAQRQLLGVSQAIEGASHIRKAPCQFGWDWGPQLPPVGIWKDVRLEGYSTARLEDVHLRQAHKGGRVTVSAEVKVDQWGAAPLKVKMALSSPRGDQWHVEAPVKDGKARLAIVVDRPQLWWPNGYGAQPLYGVQIDLFAGELQYDRRQYQTGLRTVSLRREKDQWGESFTFVVNGVPVFAKGSDWIPADSFPTRLSDAHMEKLIADAAAAHHNMLRVWGGGFYEEERFYDLCDRYGVLVWQDCVFACSIYPLDRQDFLDNLYHEVIENVRRIRHRASLALWCGNNEMEQGWESWGWSKMENEEQMISFLQNTPALRSWLSMLSGRKLLSDWKELRDAYDKFFYTTLPEWIAREDPDSDYWTSSPSSNTHFVDVNGVEMGDTHNWEVWHGNLPFKAYRQHPSRFVSEFGFQSLPALATVCTYAEPKDWNMTSYIMEHHQRNTAGNSKIITYLTDHFRMPRDFPALVYLTQLLQAEAVRTGVEYWRRNMARTSGTLYWQLNDTWPVASWASLDYYGRWKALHYFSRRFYAPLLLSVNDEGLKLDVHLTSDLQSAWQGEVAWRLESLDGKQVLASGLEAVSAGPLGDTPVCALDFSGQVSDANQRQLVFVCELLQDGQTLARQVVPFVQSKHLSLVDPQIESKLSLRDGLLAIELQSKSLARFVEVALEDGCQAVDAVFSDNYFDLPAGRSLSVTCPLPAGWTLAQAQKALRLRSLVDSY